MNLLDRYQKSLSALAEAQAAFNVENAKPEAQAFHAAEKSFSDALALRETIIKMPGGPALFEQLVANAESARNTAEADMPENWAIAMRDLREARNETREALVEASVSILTGERDTAIAFIAKAIEGAFSKSHARAVANESAVAVGLPSAVVVNGTRFEPVMTPKNRQSWPGLRTAMIAAGIPETEWTEHKTTTVRIAQKHRTICTLIP